MSSPSLPSRRTLALAGLAVVLAVLAGAVIATAWVRTRLYASLPQLDGRARVPGLTAPVTVARDDLGVVTIRAASRPDVARATGFVHAQERFFQMDLARRQAAGELAELFGEAAVEWDLGIRRHRFRAVAGAVVECLDGDQRGLLEAYTDGVNAGLAALAAPPWEHLLLRAEPAPWRVEDTILCVHAMFIALQPEDAATDSALGLAHDLLAADLFRFLTPTGTSWDAPLTGGPPPPPTLPAALPATTVGGPADDDRDGARTPGSNSWAVTGAHSHHGGALLANDMHLPLRVPNFWFRTRFEWPQGVVTGVTLPGTPAMIVGSNGHVAWGFTNSYGDFVDLVVVETDPADPGRYRTPDGWQAFARNQETVRVKGGAERTLEVVDTVWGPIIDHDHRGRARALRWTAHRPEAVNLTIAELEQATTLDQALDIAARAGIPAQNFVCADSGGRIGWTVMGRVPRRTGCDGRLPVDAGCPWQGWLTAEEQPRLVDPPDGRLWTANNRVVGGADLAALGDGGYDLGARARQIRDRLRELEHATELDMLELQLDDRALFLERWRGLLLELLDEPAVSRRPLRAEARRLVERWGGRASVGSAGYRLVRAFRLSVRERVIGALTTPCAEADPEFRPWRLGQVEDSLWRLVRERPPHLLPAGGHTWEGLLLDCLDSSLEELLDSCGSLAECTWGARNRARIRHPLSGALPFLGDRLDMPADELPGDAQMPRVQSPTFGASERMVVSPGREEEGLFHMPCGQSGHPMSPHYRAGHDAWARGRATPFLPGPAAHTLELVAGDVHWRAEP